MNKLRALLALVAAIAALPGHAANPSAFTDRDPPQTRTKQLNTLAARVTTLEQSGGGGGSGVTSVNTRTGAVTIVSGDVTSALGFTPQTALGFTPLNAASNLSDLGSASTARTNLGLGTAATQASSAFATASHTHAFTDIVSIPTGSLIYRKTAGTGAAETQTLATLKADLALTGTNSGDQTITLSGAVSGSGTAAITTTLGSGVVGLSNMANVATGTVFYRKTASTGAPEVQTLATLKTDLGLTGTNSGDQTITLTGDVTGSGTGTFATAIGANRVSRSMLAAASGAGILGATAAGNVSDLTATQVTALLNPFTSSLQGLVPSSGGGTTNYLRADGTWAAPPGTGGGSGTVTSVSVTTANGVSGSVATATTTPAITLTLGAITPTSVAATGSILSSGTAGIGYAPGAGGTVTQATTRTAGVTLNKLSGQITLFSTTATAGQVVTFTVNDSLVGLTDTVSIAEKSGTGVYFLTISNISSGIFKVSIYTPTAVGSAEAPVLQFNVIKGVIV